MLLLWLRVGMAFCVFLSDWLGEPNTFPLWSCRAQAEGENLVTGAEVCPLYLYVYGESLYISVWDFWLGVGIRSLKQLDGFFLLWVQRSEGSGKEWCLEAPSPAMFQGRFCSPPSCLWGSGLDEPSCMLQAIRVVAADKGVEKLIWSLK